MLNPLDLPVNEINGRRKKNYLFFFKSSQKNGFCCAREGGNFRDWSATNRDFFMRDVGLLDCFSPHAIFIYFKETNNNFFPLLRYELVISRQTKTFFSPKIARFLM